jgi:hypothetical protein
MVLYVCRLNLLEQLGVKLLYIHTVRCTVIAHPWYTMVLVQNVLPQNVQTSYTKRPLKNILPQNVHRY